MDIGQDTANVSVKSNFFPYWPRITSTMFTQQQLDGCTGHVFGLKLADDCGSVVWGLFPE